ncbi:putative ampG [Rickettsia rhipicephali str. Ect]|uniref:Putative ampG n=1 Tax=Rickettsia rhipicephali str. Ect TaxID=1359199 RepID=A0A0F3PGX5_RICRH|nr:putative ampG [Rickettsia rhipicephali str. Ect]
MCSIIAVIPWLDHGIQKITKNTNISIFNWIPRLLSRGMTI